MENVVFVLQNFLNDDVKNGKICSIFWTSRRVKKMLFWIRKFPTDDVRNGKVL